MVRVRLDWGNERAVVRLPRIPVAGDEVVRWEKGEGEIRQTVTKVALLADDVEDFIEAYVYCTPPPADEDE